jgi:hypothetical protein
MRFKISWFGRCCFLVEIENKKILFDPYDKYCNVDIGYIETDILISSSTWHDHGHIGVSPQAHIITYPGIEEHDGMIVTGIEAKENRSTPTVVFNLKYKDVSITNFADLGSEHIEEFEHNLTPAQRQILGSTSIAFVRPNTIHRDPALRYCQPKIIFPEHYFPRKWIEQHVPDAKKSDFLEPNNAVDEMLEGMALPVVTINDYMIEIDTEKIKNVKQIFQLLELHPQVKYVA